MSNVFLETEAHDFLSCKRIAVAGVSRSPDQAANAIYRKLRQRGYRVFAINPKAERVEGDPCYPNLGALPDRVDGVVIATHPDNAEAVVAECVEHGIRRVWMHRSFGSGSVSEAAVASCRRHGVRAIVGGCPMMFLAPVDPAHRCMRWFLNLTGRLPRAAATALLALAATLVVACHEAAPPVPKSDMVRAQELLQPFKEQLLDALMTSLEAGPENAIVVCRQRAPEIAAALSTGGVTMGRTSHRLRNPDNAPPPWAEPLLTSFVGSPEEAAPTAVWVDDATVGYLEPIRAVSFCVSCHGPAVEPPLLERIRSLYPSDSATGFRAGDLRGAFWLTLPASRGRLETGH